MIVKLNCDGLVLEQKNEFKKFHVEIDLRHESSFSEGAPIHGVRIADSSTAWVPEQILRDLPDVAANVEWQTEFSQMIETARKYGWIDDDRAGGTSIRAHVVWTGAGDAGSESARS